MNRLEILRMFKASLIRGDIDKFMSVWQEDLEAAIDYSIRCVVRCEEIDKHIDYISECIKMEINENE